MSQTITIHSTLSTAELRDVLKRYEAAHRAFLEEHSGEEDDCGETALGAMARSKSDDPEIQKRLDACKSSLAIQNPGDTSLGFQSAALAYLLKHSAPCVVDWDPGEPELGETVLASLDSDAQRLINFKKSKRRKTAPAEKRDAEPGELQILSLLRTIEGIQEDRDRMMDARQALQGLDTVGQSVFAVLIRENVRSLAAIGKHCGKTDAEVEAALTAIERALAGG